MNLKNIPSYKDQIIGETIAELTKKRNDEIINFISKKLEIEDEDELFSFLSNHYDLIKINNTNIHQFVEKSTRRILCQYNNEVKTGLKEDNTIYFYLDPVV